MILMTGNVKSCLAGKMITEQLILLLRIKLINKNFLLIRMLENDAQNLYEIYEEFDNESDLVEPLG